MSWTIISGGVKPLPLDMTLHTQLYKGLLNHFIFTVLGSLGFRLFFSNPNYFLDCLYSSLLQDTKLFKQLVVTNCSKDRPSSIVTETKKKWKFDNNSFNKRFAF